MVPSLRSVGMKVAAVHALLLLLSSSLISWAAARPLSAPPRPPAELSNSFIVTSFQDLEPQTISGRRQTPCDYAIARARRIGGKHFSIVVTGYWLGGPDSVSSFAYKSVSDEHSGGVAFVAPTVEAITRWKKGLQGCFRSAIQSGFTGVQILNHIDGDQGAWRNLVDFDPLQRYSGFAYEDVIVRPAADALRTVTRPSTKVWFMIAGEMGRSMFRHPESYMKLLAKYRGTLARGKPGSTVKVGLAIHWNKVCGNCFSMPYTTNAVEYNQTYAKAFAQQRDAIKGSLNLHAVRAMFEVCDVLGISHYAPMPLQMTFASFEAPFITAAYELSFFGVDLRRLVLRSNRDFLFSEVGIGGASPDGTSTASDLRALVENVDKGIWAVYNVAQDPWRRADYRAYRRAWFYNLLGFLSHGGGPHVKVNAAFVWSVGSFDVAGVHPISSSPEGTYADPEIVGWMTRLSGATN